MGVPLRAGRDISASDTRTSEPVIVVNETMARNLWPGQDPIGKYIVNTCGAPERRVVGVVGDVRHLALEQASGNEMYLPVTQCGDQPTADLVVRSSLPPAAVASALRSALKPVTPNLAGNDLRTLQGLVDKAVSPRRFVVLLLGGFALFALVLASLGIYGLISYSVGQRTQEIGIRMALGASAGRVKRMILRDTLAPASFGVAAGLIAASLWAKTIESLLFELTPRDLSVYALSAVAILAVVTLAGAIPSARASRINPTDALRAD
jgi:predicted lysophospholipase L1 biosynthesis ABC-type transport system permease subunit